MKSMMVKTTLREIKQSLGRYLAIFAIIALGVALFAGLKVTQPTMIKAADQYLKETQFFDYRLLSTLGFEETDVVQLSEKEEVRAAEGAMSADIIYTDAEGNESVLKAHSITEQLNKLVVVAGRLPESADECVVDSLLFGEDIIGTKLVLSENNAEEDLENFTYREYTVTGTVQSPLYIQFERGNTSLGNGRIKGFMYLLPDGFEMEYYTEIYVKFDSDYQIYSEEYEAFMEEKEPVWEAYCEAQGERRYQAVVEDAQTKIDDAKEELEEERQKAETELADAKKELEDAEAELADAETEISDAEAKIADGEAELANAEKEIRDAETEIEAKEAELAEAKQMLADREAALAAQKEMALSGAGAMDPLTAQAMQEQLAAAEAELAAARASLAEGETAVLATKEEIEAAKAEIKDKKAELAEAKEELADAKKEVGDGYAEYEDGLAEYEDAVEDFHKEIADAEAEIADAEEELADIEKPDTYVMGRGTNIGYVCFESDSGIVDGIANVFPVFFFLVAALVCMTTMNRMVEEQRTQIGVLKALGYGEASIMGKYMFYSGSAALTGSIAGFLLGTRIFPWIIWAVYGIMYRMGEFTYVFHGGMAVIALVVALLCSVGTTWISCKNELKEVAAGLMRPKSPKAGKRVFLEYVPFIWKRLKFLHKVSVRNIVRYKKRFFMMVIGISGCTALLVTGFGIMDSITDIANQQYEEIQTYDVSVSAKNAAEDTDTDELEKVLASYGASYTQALEETLNLEIDGTVKSINLVVMKNPGEMDSFLSLHTEEKEKIPYPQEGEAVISEKIADSYNIAVGDEIYLYDESRNEIKAVVSGICQNFVYNYVYIAPETYESHKENAEYKTFYVHLPKEEDLHQAGAALMNVENVTSVTINEDVRARFETMMGSMDYIITVIIVCAALLAFIVLYNLNNINITERIREIATIKVLGFYKKETASYVFRENTVLTAIGCAVGLLLGKWLHAFVMAQINIDMISFDVRVTGISYIYSILLTFVFSWVVNRLMSGKLNKINMAESLKSVD